MPELEDNNGFAEQDLFLIELPDGDHKRYAVAERFLTIDPGGAVMGVPWSELEALFRGRTLRAVPMPGGRKGVQRDGGSGMSSTPGPGFDSVPVQVNVNLGLGRGR